MSVKKLAQTKGTSVAAEPRKKLGQYMKSHGSLYNPKRLLDNFSEKMEKAKGKEPDDKFFDDAFFKDHLKVAFALGIDTHNPASMSVQEEYRHFLVEMINRVEHEHDCKTAIEKSLAETIALSHIRIIMLTKRFTDCAVSDPFLSKEATDYYNLLGKEIDRAHRQLNNAILTLKQVKTPHTALNVTAKTAFIAQNQLFNNSDSCEINDRQ